MYLSFLFKPDKIEANINPSEEIQRFIIQRIKEGIAHNRVLHQNGNAVIRFLSHGDISLLEIINKKKLT